MTRLRFLGLLSFGMVGAIALAGGACSDGTGTTTNPPDSGTTPSSDLDEVLSKLAEDCLATVALTGGVDPLTPESMASAGDAIEKGESNVPLSPSGCTRFLTERKDGAIVAETIVGPPFAFSKTNFKLRGRVTRWEHVAGGVKLIVDSDADGFFEMRRATVYEKSSVEETYAPGDVLRTRSTATVVDADFMRLVDEAMVNGQLVTTSDRLIRSVAAKCFDPQAKPVKGSTPGPDTSTVVRPCSAAELKKITDAKAAAASKTVGCLAATGNTALADTVARNDARRVAKYDCSDDYSDGDWLAANDRGYRDMYPDKARFLVTGKGLADAAGLTSTMGHELIHYGLPHDDDTETALTGASDTASRADRVNACEKACFDVAATTCTLAACAGKTLGSVTGSCTGTLTDDDIQKFEKARGAPLVPCNTGHQVGAICRNSPANKVQFCTTLDECNAICAPGVCESKSLSCWPGCR